MTVQWHIFISNFYISYIKAMEANWSVLNAKPNLFFKYVDNAFGFVKLLFLLCAIHFQLYYVHYSFWILIEFVQKNFTLYYDKVSNCTMFKISIHMPINHKNTLMVKYLLFIITVTTIMFLHFIYFLFYCFKIPYVLEIFKNLIIFFSSMYSGVLSSP